MQQDMLKMQEEMEAKEYEATVGGGMVSARVNGKHEVLSLSISCCIFCACLIMFMFMPPPIAPRYPPFAIV